MNKRKFLSSIYLFFIIFSPPLLAKKLNPKIFIHSSLTDFLSEEKPRAIIFPGSFAPKFRLGTTYQLHEVETGSFIASASIESILNVDISSGERISLPQSSNFWLEKTRIQQIQTLLNFFYGAKNDSALFIVFKNINFNKKLQVWAKATLRQRLPFATTINTPQMRQLMSKNSILVDVRAPKDTEKFKLPRSTRLPYIAKAPIEIGGYSFRVAFLTSTIMKLDSFQNMQQFLNFRKQQLNNPGRNIIVTCRNEFDHTCARALTWFHFHGLKNLYWYRGGIFSWFSLLSQVPSNIPNVKTADTKLVKTLIANKSTLLVNVNPPAFYKRVHIPGSINLPFKQPIFPTYNSLNYPKTKSDLIKGGDFFNIKTLTTKNKNTPIIVYAYDESRWRAFKAAIWLRDSGFKNIYFYRSGMASWTMLKNNVTGTYQEQ